MPFEFLKWYYPFKNGWKLCSYETKSNGYDDLSRRLHEFKKSNGAAINTFSRWSIDTLTEMLPLLEIDYCIRSLGRSELKPLINSPLHALAGNISKHFGIEFIPELIAKNRATRHLVTLNKQQREEELKGVFYINKEVDLSGKSILLVDDIRTSGTTSKFIRQTIMEQFPSATCYLFVLAQTNDGGNTREVIEKYLEFAK